MTRSTDNLRASLDNALVGISKLQDKLARIERAQKEPIAIVGVGCRFPGGVTDPESFWRLLESGTDAVTEVPSERWDIDAYYDPDPEAEGKVATRWGGYLPTVDRFDASFFGISPREALSMDPQQRLLLETSWEAIESAGIKPASLVDSRTGVFVGQCSNEYLSITGHKLEGTDGYLLTGTSPSVASGRISYALGLQGPSMTVDTACSSSLVTVHLACQALRAEECTLALAGGVNVTLTPETSILASQIRALSRTGRCHSFSADADGFVRSEGVGVLVLERLSEARRLGHRVLGLIRGSAVNQDGRSNGLTAPNGPSQEAVIREALRRGGVAPASVGYLECHGTGTVLGDPIEVQAAAAVLGEGRAPGDALVLGSLKSNIGHAEGAAGVGGLIKALLALQHGVIPKSLHFSAPNPHIPWGELPVRVASEAVAWPRGERPRIAGVSSFGISGTNAHIVLEEAPVEAANPVQSDRDRGAELIVLSGKTPGAVAEYAKRLAAHVEGHPEASVGDIASSLASTRTHHEHRVAFPVAGREALVRALATVAAGEVPSGGVRAEAAVAPKVVFVFPGQGAQWVGMGRDLFERESVFRDVMTACDRAIAAEVGWSVIDELRADAARSALDRVDVAQPMLFALAVSLAALWRSWGIEPSAVVGHSQGEVAAAYVSGAIALDAAVRVVCARSLIAKQLSGKGAMALVQLPWQEVEVALAGFRGEVSVAAKNSQRTTLISGTPAAVADALSKFEEKGVFCKRVKVDYPSHTAQVESLRGELVTKLGSMTSAAPSIPMFSTVTRAPIGAGDLDAEYWGKNLRQPVEFAAVVEGRIAEGDALLLEVSAHPVLLPALEDLRSGNEAARGASVASLHREKPGREALLAGLGVLHAHGVSVDWRAVFGDGFTRVDLPTYAWQGQRYWLEGGRKEARSGEATGHPLLGVRVPVGAGFDASAVYETVLSRTEDRWLCDHVVNGRVIVPGAGVAELVRAAGEHYADGATVDVSALVFQAPLVLPERGGQRVQLVLKEGEGGHIEVRLYSRAEESVGRDGWTEHASADVQRTTAAAPPQFDVAALRAACSSPVDVPELYGTMAAVGLPYGPAFRGLKRIWRGDGEALADVELGEALDVEGFGIHPALLDAAFQAILVLAEGGGLALPFAIDRFVVHHPIAKRALVHVKNEGGEAAPATTVTVVDFEGRVLAEVIGFRIRPFDAPAEVRTDEAEVGDAIHRIDWPAVAATESSKLEDRWLVVGDGSDARSLAAQLEELGVACRRAEPSNLGDDAEAVVCVWRQRPDETVAAAAVRLASEGLEVIQTLAKRAKAPRLYWVTTGAVSTRGEPIVDLASSALWGLGRTVMLEHPDLSCRLVDIDGSSDRVSDLVTELGRRDDESEVALRGGERRVARLVKAAKGTVPDAENYRLETTRKGMLDSLVLAPAARRSPGPGEVEISVRAMGLNFRDVVSALGMQATPGREGSLHAALGGECSGEVVAVGPGVTRVAVGDRVMAAVIGGFARYVTVDARYVARAPESLSWEEAAAVPAAFLTAWYALYDLARLKRGERILVHAAAGGVGMAAVQIAQTIGAEIRGTASPPKWDAVKALGVERVASSRDLMFVHTFRDGVDVVLNALAGEFVDSSLSLLSDGGRFVEMGKTDIRDAGQIGAKHRGVSYRAFDLAEAGLDRMAEMLDAIVDGLTRGTLRPLPVRTFAVTDAESAFRFMAQARHVGKIVLLPQRELRTDGTVLVSGGLGELGLLAARHLARRGVKHLVLTGRRGLDTPGAAAAVTELEGVGARVTVAAVDVSDRAALGQVLASIPTELPLRGVLHTAGVLDDGVLLEQSAERLVRVMTPKVGGALVLDALTRDLDLDVFVLYASAAGALGSGGQGGYAAANTFLDGLAARRQAEGLAGQSLAWGLWVNDSNTASGMAAKLSSAQQARVGSKGIGKIAPALGEKLLAAAFGRSEAQLVPVPLRLAELRKQFGEHVPPVWRALVQPRRRARQASPGGWALELAGLTEAQRNDAVLTAVRAEVARVLSLAGAEAVPADRPLKDLGLDSLMAVELRNALARRVGGTLRATLAFDYPTPAALTKHLLEEVLLLRRASDARRDARASRSGDLEEPIAIVGLGCRFPGDITDPESFWRLLSGGVDAVKEVPIERWDVDAYYDPDPEVPGKVATRWGGFLSGVDQFDTSFFGISPREAISMDPQQRLLLETSWEALENAGITPAELLDSRTGVFVGMCSHEYLSLGGTALEDTDGYRLTGTTPSVASGRISYVLGLQGPSMTVDTACSSSLVTVHLACQAIRSGECTLALAGGVNVALTPETFVIATQIQALSRSGRCHTFSADADGFVRAEGVGVVVLERLSEARRNGHRVLALIRGSAVNQDGRSNGLTAPNGPSQEAVIREALRRGGVDPAAVGYLECHGTGTVLGDPIEVQAAAAALGEGRPPERPLVLGSFKSNIGHAEGAAGVGGLIKTVLTLQHGVIPKSLHFTTPNPHIPWGELPVRVASDALDWPREGGPRIAGVSSFGISGTNAHVVLQEAPASSDRTREPAGERGAELFVLSGKVPAAVDAYAKRLAAHVASHPDENLADLGWSLATTRTHHEHRVTLATSSRSALLAGLETLASGQTPAGATRAEVVAGAKVVFVFPGQGSQWLGMGRELVETEEVFRETMTACDRAIFAETGWSVLNELRADAASSKLGRVDVVQPMLFAMAVSLAALWRSWGVEPSAVVGHSQGELAAAYVSGAMTLEDAARVVCARSLAVTRMSGHGEMALVQLPWREVESMLAPYDGAVGVAAKNSPRTTLISGHPKAVGEVLAKLETQGVFCKRVKVDYASHSSQVDALRGDLLQKLGTIASAAPAVPMLSTVTRARVNEGDLTAEYWADNLRQPVEFADVMAQLIAEGHTLLLEVSAHPVLVPALEELSGEIRGAVIGSLQREKPERETLLAGLGALHAHGAHVDWKRLFGEGRRRVSLPTYAWQRQRYWIDARKSDSHSGESTAHPLLGARLSVGGSDGTAIYEAVLTRSEERWIADHVVSGRVLLPGAALSELVRAAGEHYYEGASVEVGALVFQAPLVLPDRGAQRIQVVLKEGEGELLEARVYGRKAEATGPDGWTEHALAELRRAAGKAPVVDVAALRARCAESVDVGAVYTAMAAVGLPFGPAFRGLKSLWRGDGEAIAEIALAPGVDAGEYGVHPALLDAAFQAMSGLGKSEGLELPFSVERFVVHEPGATRAFVHVQRQEGESASVDGASLSVTLTDPGGRVLVEVTGLRTRAPDAQAALRADAAEVAEALYRIDWLAAAESEAAALDGRWSVFGDDEMARALVARLEDGRVSYRRVELDQIDADAEHVVCVWRRRADESVSGAAVRMATEGLAVVQRLSKLAKTPRLYWVTTGAVATHGERVTDVASSTLWGLGRTVTQEQPELGCKLVDLEPGAIAALVTELGRHDDENEVALRGSERRVARLVKAGTPPVPSAENYALVTARKGILDSLGLVPSQRRSPGPGEIEIAVHATGINFRDVLNALGMYPGDAGALGSECAGEVVAVGSGVTRVAVGDRVMGAVVGGFSRYVTVDARYVARVPAGLSWEEAASIPIVFLTAWYALHDLGQLKRGERVLVHAAAGGVGMAAVQIAHWIGAEVLGTASPAKWDAVKALGVERIASSRDQSFVEAFREAVGGVDVVLNSLAREFVDGSLALLSSGGRFVEMGKTDVRRPADVSAKHPGVWYRAFDLAEAGPERTAEMLDAIVEGLASGKLRPLPVQTYAVTDAESAFRFMAQARHVGKLVLLPPRGLRNDGTVLITGGLGELGLHAARYLARRGVKHLVLTGRRGIETPGAREAVAELEGIGAKITVAAVDVADRSTLGAVLGAIPAELPLRAVFHTAGVLDDGVLEDQTPERFARVMASKVEGTLVLAELTRASELDAFVLYSSGAGALGNGGQSGYAAANAFLDALAAQRRHDGLAGQSLDWGLWVDVTENASGLASKLSTALQARVGRKGAGKITHALGERLLDAALGRSDAQLVPLPLRRAELRKAFAEHVPPIWRALVQPRRRARQTDMAGWADELRTLPELQRTEAVLGVVRVEVARVLSLPGADEVAADRPLKDLGLDSLMAVELRNALGRRAASKLRATLAFDHPTPSAIARHLLEVMLASGGPAKAAAAPIAAPLEEPIAIVGIGCRFPGGVVDTESFWRMLSSGVDAVSEVPADRWDVEAYSDPESGNVATRWGGFLGGVDQFDPAFFGISPREAVTMDPQQRLLLEASWEALEKAGIPPESLARSRTAVFVGMCSQDYGALGPLDQEDTHGYQATGNAASVASGRISYVLGLQGPSMTVDTACSSSLVTLHLACQALRGNECTMALAGGANLMFTPEGTMAVSQLQALSPTGRCHTFSSDADGFVRAEGIGMVVLERLSDARRNGHRVLALVRGSAVNQDGRSNGLTAPNGPAQEAVIREALRRGGVAPTAVGYLECHGTGTSLGDPIEVQSAAAVLGEGRGPDSPLVLGSLKSNIGHAEGAAGIGGLIKAVLAFEHGAIPRSLHFKSPNPHIPWSDLPVSVASEMVAWPRGERPRIAGVSAFGISGTNAHVVLEEPPTEPPSAPSPERAETLVVLSGKTSVAVEDAARRLADHLTKQPEASVADVAWSLATTRSHHEHRASIVVDGGASLVRDLEALARGETPGSTVRGEARSGKTAWLFTGQGSQRLGMGRALAEQWPAFRETHDAVVAALDVHLDVPLRDVMWGASAETLHQTKYAQPALFALEVALAALMQSWGLHADYMIGHSLGEISAAHVAGVFSLEDAARLVVARGRSMQALPEGGAMISIAASEREVAARLERFQGKVSIAGINGAESTVISGAVEAVEAVAAHFATRGARTKRLDVSHAFHSALMEPMLADFERLAQSIEFRPARVPIVSNVSGRLSDGELSTPRYWVTHVREAVRFMDSVRVLEAAGVTRYLELGPKATLLGLVPSCLVDAQRAVALVGALKSDRSDERAILEALGALHVHGARVDWKGVFGDGLRSVELPTYAWQRQRYWVNGPKKRDNTGEPTGHPLLGARLSVAGSDASAIYEAMLSRSEDRWICDHVVSGQVLVPGAALGEIVRAAGEHFFEGARVEVGSLVFQAPLPLPERGGQRVQVVLKEGNGDARDVQLFSRGPDSTGAEGWTEHATGEVRRVSGETPSIDIAALRARCPEPVDMEEAYAALAALGVPYGPVFRGLRRLWKGSGEAVGEIELAADVDASAYGVHPALLDAAFHALRGLDADVGLSLPFSIDRLAVYEPGARRAFVHVRNDDGATSESAALAVTLADADGRVLVEIHGFRTRQLDPRALARSEGIDLAEALYRTDWLAAESPSPSGLDGRWLIVGDGATARDLAARLKQDGVACQHVAASQLGGDAEHVVCVWPKSANEPAATAAVRVASEGLAIVQRLAKLPKAPRLYWVTTGALSTRGEPVADVATSTLWGLGRTVTHEHPDLSCKLIDVEAGRDVAADLVLELGQHDDEHEVALRGGERRVARLVKAGTRAVPQSENYRLETTRKGMLDSLTLSPSSRRAPGPGEIEIAVRAMGVNFRDVMNALGMYPGEAGALGAECAGEVVAVGPGVSRVAVGDRVMGLAGGTHARYVTVDARQMARVPAQLSWEQAASIPAVFLTAWYALHDLGSLKRGERVLVHAAAGGVGMAAVQIARLVGAEVYGTASAPKWDTLKTMGVDRIASSRDQSFVEAFRDDGGVDVVLNALAGDFIDGSLSLLKAGGRFLEMGKTDVRDPAAVAKKHPGVSYRAFDLMEAGPDRLSEMLDDVVSGLTSGKLRPLPLRSFAVTDAETAFRFMAQARHIGKVVLLPVRGLRTDGTVLITGGLGALGLHAARYLATRGVKHLVLTGRRGMETPGAAAAVAELHELGARVTVAAVDASDRASVARVLDAIPLELPLRGVIHTAGVLDDGVLIEQSPARFAGVMSSKVGGAVVLDELTRTKDLDAFVLYASAAGTLGSAGQGSYAAANTFLDALAARRRAEGLAGLSLAWGLWVSASNAASGMAAKLSSAQLARVGSKGIGKISPALGEAILEAAFGRDEAHLVPVPLRRAQLRKQFAEQVPPLWRALVQPIRRGRQVDATGWAKELLSLPDAQRKDAALAVVRAEVARVLSLAGPDSVGADRPLKELGLDSLMAVELRNALGRRVGATLRATLAFDYPTPAAIAQHVTEQILAVNKSTGAKAPAVQRATDEAIAIVGIGCRYPGGVTDPESLWRLLEAGVDAISEVPKERWDIDAWYDPDPETPAKMVTRWGGFLSDLDLFDPAFFDFSPREAVSVDPQQRLLFETAWEALERAGIAPSGLMGSDTGVFIGLYGREYQMRALTNLATMDALDVMGGTPATQVGRLSYWLGLKGPNMPIDTACSSSLVAVHLACQALRSGECSLVLAGGVNVTLAPEATIALSRFGALSPTGRCQAFSSDANGFVRSEGAGVVVLERLSDAQRNGHPILAVIRGSAVNQDGRSNGPAAPNGPSQEAVIKAALQRGGVAPAEVGYLECHGTGTPLGDPIEVQSAAAVFGQGRDASEPLILGSLKSNIGHAEAAAGVGGLIKAVLCLQHGRIPQSLHARTLNRYIPWEDLPVKVASDPIDWPANGKSRIAGVSSFGISGTNAHVVLEEARPVPTEAAPSARPAELVVLSAKTPRALDEMAARLAAHLTSSAPPSLLDVASNLALSRRHHEHRLAIATSSVPALAETLHRIAQGETPPTIARDATLANPGKLAWIFAGQGSQTLGMGRALFEAWPAFRRALEEAWTALDPHLGVPLRSVMWAEPGSAQAKLLDETEYTQPALFAFGWALGALARSWGIKPDCVAGHSIGELIAACVAEIFTLEDAARLVTARARLMQSLPERGVMVAIESAEAEVLAAIDEARAGDRVSIAAINSPTSVVLSGAEIAVAGVVERFVARGVRTKRLKVSHAFHSPLMDPMLDEFRRVAESIRYRAPAIPLVSNLTGRLAGAEVATSKYWLEHARAAVRFGDGVATLHALGVTRYLELGAAPTLLGLVPECISDAAAEPLLVATMQRGRPEAESVLAALGALYAAGGSVAWDEVFPAPRRHVDLPTYPWQRARYWLEANGVSSVAAEGSLPAGGPKRSVAALLAGYLGKSISEYPPDVTLGDVGIDSLMLASLRAAVAHSNPERVKWARSVRLGTSLKEVLSLSQEETSPTAAVDADSVAAVIREFAAKHPVRGPDVHVDKASVRKNLDGNVLIAVAEVVDKGSVQAVGEIRRVMHPFFYEHELDHIPGLYLIEACRQLASWYGFAMRGPSDGGGTWDALEADFFEFVEHEEPVYGALTFESDGTVSVRVYQASRLKALLTIAGRRIDASQYAALRSNQRSSMNS